MEEEEDETDRGPLCRLGSMPMSVRDLVADGGPRLQQVHAATHGLMVIVIAMAIRTERPGISCAAARARQSRKLENDLSMGPF